MYVVDQYSKVLLGLSGQNGSVLSTARLYGSASGVAVNSSGELFVANSDAGTISVFSSNGTWMKAYQGDFPHPTAVAADSAGNVYITSSLNHIAVVSPDGEPLRLITRPLWQPDCLTFDRYDNLFLCDHVSNRIVQLAPNGTLLSSIDNVPASGIALDDANNLVIADDRSQRVRILAQNGTQLYEFVANQGEAPTAVTVGTNGLLYVTTVGPDYDQNHVVVLSSNASKLASFNVGSFTPLGIVQDHHGNLVVSGDERAKVLAPNGSLIFTFSMTGWAVAINPSGDVLLCDNGEGRVLVIEGVAGVNSSKSMLPPPSSRMSRVADDEWKLLIDRD